MRLAPDHSFAHWLLGSLYLFELHQPEKALPCFKKSTELSPKSERASLGLFHSLWSLGKEVEALEEMKRYQRLTNFQCQDYREILGEITEKFSTNRKRSNKKSTGKEKR